MHWHGEPERETHDAVMAEVVGTKRQTNAYAANQAVMPPSFLVAA